MTKHYRTLIAPLAAVAALAATPASAQEFELTHPTSICVEQRTIAELGGTIVDLVLAEAGFAEAPQNFEEDLTTLASDCVEEHGIPDIESVTLGRYAAARAMHLEATARLEEAKMDMVWLNKTLSDQRIAKFPDFVDKSNAVIDRMALAAPDGLGIDAREGSYSDQLLGILVYVYISSQSEINTIEAELSS